MKTAGRILHHIQDMSTPSHTLPIFHAPFSLWKEFPNYKDKFEEYSAKEIKNRLAFERVKKISQDNSSSASGLMELYDESAQQTFAYLGSEDAKIKGKDAQGNKVEETNCPKGDKAAGSGKYGPHEQNFGETGAFTVEPSCVKDRITGVQVSCENYIHIYDHLIAKMVADSLSALLLVQEVYNRTSLGDGD
jgi:hypothetical protein